jgi:hypothetical protein
MTNLVRTGTRRVSTILPSVLAIVFAADAAPAQETPTSQYGSEIQPSAGDQRHGIGHVRL